MVCAQCKKMNAFEFLQVRNRVDEFADGRKKIMRQQAIKHVVVHRTLPDGTAKDVHHRFVHGDLRDVTGGQNPYHFVIESGGACVQVMALNEEGAHARMWNPCSLGVAIMRDMRKTPPDPRQYQTLLSLLQYLCLWIGGVTGVVFGHDELRGASKDPDKECPGRHLDMMRLRSQLIAEVEVCRDMRGSVAIEYLMLGSGISMV